MGWFDDSNGPREDAYGRDADFYSFTRSLETYERTIDPGTMLILGTDSDLLRYFGRPR